MRSLNTVNCPPLVVIGSSFIFVWTDGFFMKQFFLGADPGTIGPMLAFVLMFMMSCIPLILMMVMPRLNRGLADRFEGFLLTPRGVVLAGVVATAGTFFYILGDVISSSLIFSVGSISGIGYGCLLLAWGRIYGRNRAKSTYLTIPGVFACSILIDTPMLLMMPVARGVAFAITPIVSGLFLAYYYRHDEASDRLVASSNDVLGTRDSDTHIILGSSNVRRLQGIPVSYLLAIGLFTMAFGYMQYLTSFSVVSDDISSVIVTSCRGLTAMVLLVAMGLMSVKPHQLYRLGFMISIAGFLIIPLLSHPSSTAMLTLTAAIIIIGDTAFDAFVWIIGSEFSDFTGRHPDFKPFALVHAVVALSLCCGILISCALFQVGAFPSLFGHATTIICYLLIISVALLLSSDTGLWTILKVELSPAPQEVESDHGQMDRDALVGRFVEKHGLTSRENDVLMLILSGRSVKKMAEELFLSEHTIVSHVRHIYKKADCHSRQELIDKVLSGDDLSSRSGN